MKELFELFPIVIILFTLLVFLVSYITKSLYSFPVILGYVFIIFLTMLYFTGSNFSLMFTNFFGSAFTLSSVLRLIYNINPQTRFRYIPVFLPLVMCICSIIYIVIGELGLEALLWIYISIASLFLFGMNYIYMVELKRKVNNI
ncbi:hypothetical protein [Risungbinella massiliensis]|uniref:hypothetical protein n=1 Tax=Risungbinella massiliensis TaxID=1329796 RepID=UPI0005CBCB51|nr:hypothetical protein [Risungbinella massiliensis]